MNERPNVLITGIHGFVGGNLIECLKSQYDLYGLDIISPYKDGVIKTYSWEAFSGDGPVRFDAIIHLAGKAHDLKNASDPDSYFRINTHLTQKIYDFFLQSPVKKFIFFSSVKAAADCVVGSVLTEDVIPVPKGPYGESKIRAEEYIRECSAKDPDCLCGQKKVYILRPCMIHGPGNKGNLNLLYNVVKKGIPWPLGDFDNRRSFASVDNICYVVKELLDKEVESGVYHIGDDDPISTNELIQLICETLGKKPHIWRLNKNLMETCAGLGTLLQLPLNIERLHKLTENYVVSNEKIKKALHIEKMPVDTRQGLIKTIRSFETKEVALY